MVVGVGVDLIEVARIRRILEDPKIGRRFRDRVFTENEIRYCEAKGRAKYKSYAGRFAAKEAVMKSFGRGWGSEVSWSDIEILPAGAGKPVVFLYNKTAALASRLGVRRLAISITHTEEYAMAYGVAEGD